MAWTNMAAKSNGVVVDQGDWNQMVANFAHLGGADGNTKTGNYSITGTVYVAGGVLTVGGPAAGTGGIRTTNDSGGALAWRNGGGTADLLIYPDSINRFTWGGTWNLGGSVPSGASLTSLNVVVAGNAYRIPLQS